MMVTRSNLMIDGGWQLSTVIEFVIGEYPEPTLLLNVGVRHFSLCHDLDATSLPQSTAIIQRSGGRSCGTDEGGR
jgi:hypothetical protein